MTKNIDPLVFPVVFCYVAKLLFGQVSNTNSIIIGKLLFPKQINMFYSVSVTWIRIDFDGKLFCGMNVRDKIFTNFKRFTQKLIAEVCVTLVGVYLAGSITTGVRHCARKGFTFYSNCERYKNDITKWLIQLSVYTCN